MVVVTLGLYQEQTIFGTWLKSAETDRICVRVSMCILLKKKRITDFIFLGSKITVRGDCSLGIKRHMLLDRKAMTNLNSILKAKTSLCQQKSVWSKLWFFQ